MKPEKNKSKIIEASLMLFCEKGFNSTSMKEIADRAGVSIGNCYNHFSSKEEVYTYLFKINSPKNDALTLTSGIDTSLTAEQNIERVFNNIIDFVEKNTYFFKLILIDVNEFSGKHICGIFDDFLRPAEDYLSGRESILSRLRKDISSSELTTFMVWMFYSIGVTNIVLSENFKGSFKSTPVYKVLVKALQKGLVE